MADFFTMPKQGVDMEEGTLVKWLKNEGDYVKKGEMIATIETDKTTLDVESLTEGIIKKIYCGESETVPCGTPLAFIGGENDEIPEANPSDEKDMTKKPAERAKMPMDKLFTMPKQGVDMEEGTLVKWLKNEGDYVKKGEMIATIETDKTTLDVECLTEGIVRKLYCGESETVPCGTPLAFIGADTDPIPDVSSMISGNIREDTPEVTKRDGTSMESADNPVVAAEQPVSTSGRIFATPRARKLAAKEGIDISMVYGTGISGRIVEYDVRQFINNGGVREFTEKNRVRLHNETVIPFKGIRKATAKHMLESLSSMAQAHMTAEIDAANLVSLRAQLNRKYENSGKKISYLDLIIAAAARSLVEHPDANAELREDGIYCKNYANIGVAVNTDKGLFVPVIKDADILQIPEIDEQVKKMVGKAREGKLTGEEMSGGTFTVSNLGMYEIDTFTAIINPPETCILAVSRITDKVVAVGGQPTVRPIMSICLTYDHRLIDGAPAASFLTTLRYYLENPAWTLL